MSDDFDMFPRWFFPAMVLMALGVISFLAFNAIIGGRKAEERSARQNAWYSAHHCQPSGYVGNRSGATRLYRCDDGLEYIWSDIPEAQ